VTVRNDWPHGDLRSDFGKLTEAEVTARIDEKRNRIAAERGAAAVRTVDEVAQQPWQFPRGAEQPEDVDVDIGRYLLWSAALVLICVAAGAAIAMWGASW
jgi:hypothetical protein